MTDTTIVFRLADKRLTDEERQTVLDISRKLYTRDIGTASAPAVRKLPEAQFRVDRGDL
jgi:hypothetical protein